MGSLFAPTSAPTGTAIERPGINDPGIEGNLLAWMTRQKQQNPGFQLPKGMEVGNDGQVKFVVGGAQKAVTIMKWAAIAGIVAGGGYAAMPYLTGAAGAGAAGAGAGAGGTAAATGGALGTLGTIKSIWDTAQPIIGALTKGRADGRTAEATINQNQARAAADLYRAQIEANANENRYGLESTTGQNTFDLGLGNLDLGRTNSANQFALGRFNAGLAAADTDLAQRKFALTAPGVRAGTAVRGDILSRAQDATFSGVPSKIPQISISGGLRPSMFSPDTRALGADMTSQARAQQAKGDVFATLPELPNYTAPGAMPTYKAPPPYVKPPPAPTLPGVPQSTGLDTTLTTLGTVGGIGSSIWDLIAQYKKKNSGPAATGGNFGSPDWMGS